MAEEKKKEFRCETCPMRKKYDENPRSILGILWKLHTYICPGWRGYQRHLAQQSPNK